MGLFAQTANDDHGRRFSAGLTGTANRLGVRFADGEHDAKLRRHWIRSKRKFTLQQDADPSFKQARREQRACPTMQRVGTASERHHRQRGQNSREQVYDEIISE